MAEKSDPQRASNDSPSASEIRSERAAFLLRLSEEVQHLAAELGMDKPPAADIESMTLDEIELCIKADGENRRTYRRALAAHDPEAVYRIAKARAFPRFTAYHDGAGRPIWEKSG